MGNELLTAVAKLCLEDEVSQQEVAKMLGLSQPKVSRLLKEARDKKIVKLAISAHDERSDDLEMRLCRDFALDAAIVVNAGADASADSRRTLTGYFSREFVQSELGNCRKIAVAGGRTVRSLVDAFRTSTARGELKVLQAMGNAGAQSRAYDASEVARLLCSKLGGALLNLNLPALAPDVQSARRYLEHGSIAGLMDELDNVDAALVGIGSLDESIFAEQHILSDGDLNMLRSCGAVGEICGRFFDRNGVECNCEMRDRVAAISLESLRKCPLTIAVVAAGAARAEAIGAALRGGLVRNLICDDQTARALLTSKEKETMRILVPIKQVPETSSVRMDPETGTVIRSNVESIVNPLDLYAVEAALELKEKYNAQVIVLSMGPPQAQSALREVMAMGVDQGVLLTDRAFAGSDTWATSLVLAEAAKKLGHFDLIICGERAVDGDTGQVGPEIASCLSLPCASYVCKIESVSENSAQLCRLLENGREHLEMQLPALLTVVKEISDPRLPTFRGKLKARDTELTVWDAGALGINSGDVGLSGSPTRVVKIFSPKVTRQCELHKAENDAELSATLRRLDEFLAAKELEL